MSTSNPPLEGLARLLARSRIQLDSISIRAFRAIDDRESATRFSLGHKAVITAFGFELSSAKESWLDDPNTYVVIIESQDRVHTYGGSRIQKYSTELKLPAECAIGLEAPEIHDFIQNHGNSSFAEICGLWNSIAVAGLGIGSVFSIRAAIALAGLIGVKEMIALCSVHTYRAAHKYGFNLLKEVGNGGMIPYAGAHQTASLTFQYDVDGLPNSDEKERNIIRDLRINPSQVTQEYGNSSPLEIHYNLNI